MMHDAMRTGSVALYAIAFIVLVLLAFIFKTFMKSRTKNGNPIRPFPEPKTVPKSPPPIVQPEATPSTPPPSPPSEDAPKTKSPKIPRGIVGVFLLLLAIIAIIIVITRATIANASWELVALVVLSGMLFSGYVLSATLLMAGHRVEETPKPLTEEAKTEPKTPVEPKQELVVDPPAVVALAPNTVDEEARNAINQLSQRIDELKTDPAISTVKTDIATIRTEVKNADVLRKAKLDEISKDFGQLQKTFGDWPAKFPQLRKDVDRLSDEIKGLNQFEKFEKTFERWNLVHHLLLKRPDVPSTLIEKVKSRYLLLLKNDHYRTDLATWARSDELRLVLKHSRDLYRESARLLVLQEPITERRRSHWEQLNHRAAKRLHAVIPLLDRLAALRDITDESESVIREIMQGLRPLEEKVAWAIIPRPHNDVARTLEPATTERYLQESAKKLLELIVVPLALLFQEVFEARVIEDSVLPEEQDRYESTPFEEDHSRRGSVLDAIESAAKLLGFTYRPIRLYSSVRSESGQFLKSQGHTRVTWQEWRARDDERGGMIVRLERPAFTEDASGALFQDGAIAIIGGPGNAGRE
jgi:hypothetical protein